MSLESFFSFPKRHFYQSEKGYSIPSGRQFFSNLGFLVKIKVEK